MNKKESCITGVDFREFGPHAQLSVIVGDSHSQNNLADVHAELTSCFGVEEAPEESCGGTVVGQEGDVGETLKLQLLEDADHCVAIEIDGGVELHGKTRGEHVRLQRKACFSALQFSNLKISGGMSFSWSLSSRKLFLS